MKYECSSIYIRRFVDENNIMGDRYNQREVNFLLKLARIRYERGKQSNVLRGKIS